MAVRARLFCFLSVLALILLPSRAVAHDCEAARKSALAEPEWYLSECLGGVRPSSPQIRHTGPRVAGDTTYILNVRAVGTFPSSLVTAPLPTLTYTLVGAQARPIFAMDFDLPATTLWGIDNTTREYGTFNLSTGAFTASAPVTGIPAANTITGMKFDPTSTTVYVSSTDGTTSQLHTLDLSNGVATLVGPITGFSIVIDIAISNSGQMYGHDIGLDQILTINKTNGAGTLVGATGVNASFAQGMDFDPSTDILYAWLYQGGGVNQLATIDLATGAASTVVNGEMGPENEGAIQVAAGIELSPAALAVDDGFNKVMEPGETVAVEPSWSNTGAVAVDATGTASNFTGPAGATYTIVDSTSIYPVIPANTTQKCTDCYFLNVTAASRPSAHWDASFQETLTPSPALGQTPGGTGSVKVWTVHIGDSFADMIPTNPFTRFVETIFHNQITAGGACGAFCPDASTLRKQMAVFVLKAVEGAGYAPPAAVGIFNDVPAGDPFAPWIEELFNRGVVAGCSAPGGPNYCPEDPVLRQQMAVFLLRTLEGSAYTPPACIGFFTDVPCPSLFADWIEEISDRGITAGCAPGPQYCPTDPVKRQQMAVFLTVTFNLLLYGP